jgi:hypothetical protein
MNPCFGSVTVDTATQWSGIRASKKCLFKRYDGNIINFFTKQQILRMNSRASKKTTQKKAFFEAHSPIT